MTFPIHPNNYNSLLPSPRQPEESNAFSEGIRRVRLLRSAQLECITLALVWLDIALVTHQIILDYSLSPLNSSTDSNLTDWAPAGHREFRNDHPALKSAASMALFITITTLSFVFFLEGIGRNIHSRVTQRRVHALNVVDATISGASFVLNLSLLVARVSPLARDFVALLIALRLIRMVSLIGGVTTFEKQQILQMLEGYRREECFNSEHQRMLQTELENRTKECQDLRELVKSATLSRNRLKQKQQLQMKQLQGQPVTAGTDGDAGNGIVIPKRGGVPSGQDDSGHSSDSSPGTPPVDAFGRLPTSSTGCGGGAGDGGGGGVAESSSGCGTPSDIELTGVQFGGDHPNEKSLTSRM